MAIRSAGCRTQHVAPAASKIGQASHDDIRKVVREPAASRGTWIRGSAPPIVRFAAEPVFA
jgi:hypothetical protein